MKPNYAFKPIAERAPRSNQTIVPQRLNAALEPMKYFALPLILCAVSGCDTVRGVTRTSDKFGTYPDTNCVVNAVMSINGMSNVTYEQEVGSRPLTAHGIEKPDVVHRYWYEYKGLRNNFFFTVRFDGAADLFHGYICLNCIPSQEDIEKIYPAILALEEALEGQCSLTGLRSNAKEHCMGVRCAGF